MRRDCELSTCFVRLQDSAFKKAFHVLSLFLSNRGANTDQTPSVSVALPNLCQIGESMSPACVQNRALVPETHSERRKKPLWGIRSTGVAAGDQRTWSF